MKQLTLSQAIEGFVLEKEAQRLSPHTLADYDNAFRKLPAYLGGDPGFRDIKPEQLKLFLRDLATPRAPDGVAPRPVKPLSNKTILNIHTALSSLCRGRWLRGACSDRRPATRHWHYQGAAPAISGSAPNTHALQAQDQ
jgi:hypothetical protein